MRSQYEDERRMSVLMDLETVAAWQTDLVIHQL
jgi:hypothetical protein